MKTRRSILFAAGIPEAELDVIRKHDLDISPGAAEADTAAVLRATFTWSDTPQGAKYWHDWHPYIRAGGLRPTTSAPGATAHADLRDRMAIAALQAIIVQGADPAGAYAAADRALAFRETPHE